MLPLFLKCPINKLFHKSNLEEFKGGSYERIVRKKTDPARAVIYDLALSFHLDLNQISRALPAPRSASLGAVCEAVGADLGEGPRRNRGEGVWENSRKSERPQT